ncbi:hypothetical protein NLG42_16960 [Flavobacterium plurextorum]|uniref:hypothetical protein n=1 Tax=Flavobacterium TaxID=237 RepID=UPI00214D3168|nr:MULTISPECIES: hypothetical protein [Flavobacterium]UUW07785.1 hypothetical protein NLG42_16960 [Flavobacterium plurextorum]
MMTQLIRKLFFLQLVLFAFHANSQVSSNNELKEDQSISTQLYTKCFENLNQGSEILEKYPAFKDSKLCSLLYCTLLLSYQENEIKLIAEQRLQGIVTQLFREGNPVYLISGMESYEKAVENNKNLEDDNHIVYISIGACQISSFESKARDIVNKQTMLLIKQASSK